MKVRCEAESPQALGMQVDGALTLAVAAEFRTQLLDAFARTEDLSIDLGGVTAVDVSGLQLLIAAGLLARRDGRRLHFAAPLPACVEEAWQRAGLGPIALPDAGAAA